MRRIALGLATAAVAVALALALGELLVRAVVGPPARLLATGSFRDDQGDFDVVYGVSERGTRRTCGPEADRAGSELVAVIGDSFVFGQGVADCEDFVSLLNQISSRKRFVNLGLIGSGIDEYRIVARDLLDGASEVVLVFFGNDVADVGGARSAAGRLADESSATALLRRAWRAWRLRRLRERTRDEGGPVAYFDGRPNNVLSVLRQDPDGLQAMVEPPDARVAAFRERFAELTGSLVERFGAARVSITCVPDGQTVSRAFASFVRDHGGSLAPFGAPGRAYELVRELSREHGLRFIDVFPGFVEGGDELYHPHDLHWTPAGHRRMAELLAGSFGLSAPERSAAAEAREAPVVPSVAP